jgi:hypothetical protein
MMRLPQRWEPVAAPGGHGHLLLAFDGRRMLAILPPGTCAWRSEPALERGGWRLAAWADGIDDEPLLGVDAPETVAPISVADMVAVLDAAHHDFIRAHMHAQLAQARTFERTSEGGERCARASGQVDRYIVGELREAFPLERWYEPRVGRGERVPDTAGELLAQIQSAVSIPSSGAEPAAVPAWLRTVHCKLRLVLRFGLPSQLHPYAKSHEDRLKTFARQHLARAPRAAPALDEELAQCEFS